MLTHDRKSSSDSCDAAIDPLLNAVLRADEEAVRKALHSGSDVNAVLKDGRNVITALLTGKSGEAADASSAPSLSHARLNILTALISHRDISLYTLNATHASLCGVTTVTPLGVATLLNKPAAVQAILESCSGLISVDFADSVGGTPLMYACRSGNLDVAQHLLANGARPDFRDAEYRTSIHFALPHSRVLWHCEDVLRRHRAQEILNHHNKRNICFSAQHNAKFIVSPAIPPTHFMHKDPDFTHALLEAVSSSRPQTLHSLLFPTNCVADAPSPLNYLINIQDSRGWSPMHHCAWAAKPSIEVMDLLYLASADVSLPTASEFYTPLHCLAMSSSRPRDPIDAAMLYSFAVHLIRDLRAPLASQDRNGETCIHIAAEHGHNIDVLLAFLDCDAKSTVREIRNSRGLTAAEVAKREYRVAFGLEGARPESAASMRTIKPMTSQKSLKSMASFSSIASITTPYDYIPESIAVDFAPAENGILPLFEQVLRDLRFISRALSCDIGAADLDSLEDLLVNTLDMGSMLLARARGPVDAAVDSLQKVQSSVGRLSGLLNAVSRDVEDKLEYQCISRWDEESASIRRRTTDSGSSGSTFVSQTSLSAPASVSGSTKVGSNADLTEDDVSKPHISGTVKLKNWFKKKLRPDSSRSSKEVKPKPEVWEGQKGTALRSSDRVLERAGSDLVSIEECMSMADQYIATGHHFISKAETIFSQAIRSRQVAIHNARNRQMALAYLDPTLFTLPDSRSSSRTSSPEPEEAMIRDEELLNSFRRFLVKKVDIKVEGAYAEIEKANVWIKIVKDVVRGLKQSTAV